MRPWLETTSRVKSSHMPVRPVRPVVPRGAPLRALRLTKHVHFRAPCGRTRHSRKAVPIPAGIGYVCATRLPLANACTRWFVAAAHLPGEAARTATIPERGERLILTDRGPVIVIDSDRSLVSTVDHDEHEPRGGSRGA